ncbi:MAG TPA: hypothetical protein VF624_13505 [Tepidisphaeraceae bacterium]
MQTLILALDWFFRRTLCSVKFGIFLLVMIALYVSIGSGVHEVREYFETDELAFFNAWPFKLLMVLLVATLVTVTLERIPFTLPRLGAWIVHTGIVTLVAGGWYYYAFKIEGAVLIGVGGSVQHYYDRWERALYAKVKNETARVPLAALPRFHAYDASLANADYLDRRGLKELSPVIATSGPLGGQTIGEAAGVPSLKLRVTGYWPYADVHEKLVTDEKSNDVGFVLSMPDERTGRPRDQVLMRSAPRNAWSLWGPVEFSHRVVESQAEAEKLAESAKRIHKLAVRVKDFDQTLDVEIGRSYPLGGTGYAITPTAFDPKFPAMNGDVVSLLTVMVTTPTQTFRRQLIPGREAITDWLLGAPGAGPMGKRQDKPLDADLVTSYTLDDAAKLLPSAGYVQYAFVTAPDSLKTTVISVGLTSMARVTTLDVGGGVLKVFSPQSPQDAMAGLPPQRGSLDVPVRRESRAKLQQTVVPVPKEQRNRDEGQAGIKQVVKVTATADDFSTDVLVPFSDRPLEGPWQDGWLTVPGATAPLQLQIGNNYRTLPARIKLEKFEADAYGGLQAGPGAMMRDFRSYITLTDRQSGATQAGVTYMNTPVFYKNGDWIFFQSGWDAQNQQFTILGVGNRPGVTTMAVGCGLIIVGIGYAFYLKPVIIQRMKNKALANAGGKKREPVEAVAA